MYVSMMINHLYLSHVSPLLYCVLKPQCFPMFFVRSCPLLDVMSVYCQCGGGTWPNTGLNASKSGSLKSGAVSAFKSCGLESSGPKYDGLSTSLLVGSMPLV